MIADSFYVLPFVLPFGNVVDLIEDGALSSHVVGCVCEVVTNQPHEFLDRG